MEWMSLDAHGRGAGPASGARRLERAGAELTLPTVPFSPARPGTAQAAEMRHIQVQLSRNIAFLARFADKQAPMLPGGSDAQDLRQGSVLAHSMGQVARGTTLLQKITALEDGVMAGQEAAPSQVGGNGHHAAAEAQGQGGAAAASSGPGPM